MNLAHPLAIAALSIGFAAASAGAQDDKLDSHHPAGEVSAPAAKAKPGPAAVQSLMKSMQAMHEKMMAAKTPEERDALMAEHMKLMQRGMSMMQSMRSEGTKTDPAVRQRMMEMRMDMMQSMMQMMMDRAPAPPAGK